MASAQIPQRLRNTSEALPVVVVLNFGNHFTRQILRDASLAEHIRTLGAAVHFASLSAPATVQFTAIFALIELPAVIECIALFALCGSENGMHLDGGCFRGCSTKMLLAWGAVQTGAQYHIDVWIGLNVMLPLLGGDVWLKFKFETYKGNLTNIWWCWKIKISFTFLTKSYTLRSSKIWENKILIYYPF